MSLRWPILLAALFFGASLATLGGNTACVIQPPEPDGGPDGAPIMCDQISLTPGVDPCDTCQACSAMNGCGVDLQACEKDPKGQCVKLSQAVGACKEGDVACDTTACVSVDNVDSRKLYAAASSCVFQKLCPEDCYGRYVDCAELLKK